MSDFKHILPADIERTSMGIIQSELKEMGISLDPENAAVILRAIHTTADFGYAETLRFTPGAVKKGVAALTKGRSIVTDTNMAKAGVSRKTINRLGGDVFCYMSDEDIISSAKESGVTRAVMSMRKASEAHPDAVYAIGNAPTALIELCGLIGRGLRPSLIIGVPVGFVNVVESKEMLLGTCTEYGVPAIIAMGRKGGSNVAAAICNALLYTAADMIDPYRR